MALTFVTGNKGKFAEAESILKEYGIKIEHSLMSIPEERAENCQAIAEGCARRAYEALGKPLFVEDSGLFIESLNGFPGTYSAWAFSKLGCEGVLKLMTGTVKRDAQFITAIGYADEGTMKVFVGICNGKIAESRKGTFGFAYDSVFIPDGESKTFAEDIAMKSRVSHRKKALVEFAEWLKKR
jgi:XTP/dITP diphosphohydrolase